MPLFLATAKIIASSAKFYFPAAANVLEGRAYADVFDLLQLPFDSVSILSEAYVNDSGEYLVGDVYPTITVAFEVNGLADKETHFSAANTSPDGAWIYVVGLIFDRRINQWIIGSAPCIICKSEAGSVDMYLGQTALARELKKRGLTDEQAVREMVHDKVVATNLCAMLAMKNVRTRDVPGPSRLNAKRAKKGKFPLYSYHVLEVDGEVWDQPELQQKDGPHEFRSHLRRGHIRRLDPQRSVWVRAAFVRGKVDGFVDKSYSMKNQERL